MKPSELLQIKEIAASLILTLRGDFDSELDELKKLIQEWDKRSNLDKLIAKFESDKMDFQMYADKVNKEHDDKDQEHLDKDGSLNDCSIQLKEGTIVLHRSLDEFNFEKETHRSNVSQWTQEQIKKSKELKQLNDEVESLKISLTKSTNALDAKEKVLNERLAKLALI